MARVIIADTVAAGNATAATIYTMPPDYSGFIGNIVATNTTGGALDLTLYITRNGADNVLLAATAINGGAVYYGRNSTNPVCQLAMRSGDILKAMGSGAGINVTVSGMRFST
jgi:hypothetical protein